MDSYFASVEQQERPHLRGKPVAITPLPSDYTCAIAASYEAKAYGIKTGTKIYAAKRMCPNLSCVPARHDVYVRYHESIIAEIIKHTPINNICSIDELSSRLPPTKRNITSATKIAQNIKNGLCRNVGEAIKCSIGIAPNALLAKIASDMNKPNGIMILQQEDLPGPLLNLDLVDLPGIGANMEKRLFRANVRSIKDLWDISPKQARKIWNSVQGERFWYWLHGHDFEAPETRHTMIGHSRILDPQLRAPDKARLMARSLLTKASFRMRRKNLFAGALSLSTRTTEGQRWDAKTRFPSAQDPFTFLHHLDKLWQAMLHNTSQKTALTYYKPLYFKKVSVVLYELSSEDQICEDLFEMQEPEHILRAEKYASLTKALDSLRKKYHKETVSLGVPPKTMAGYVGTKIAFSRVPEQEEFWS